MNGCTHSQFRMGFRINNSSDVRVAGLTVRESGGDGMIVMSNVCHLTSCQNVGASKRILIRDVTLDRNMRQGMSVISAQDMTVINTTFSNIQLQFGSSFEDLSTKITNLEIQDRWVHASKSARKKRGGVLAAWPNWVTHCLQDRWVHTSKGAYL